MLYKNRMFHEVKLELTHRCNQRCEFCQAGTYNGPRGLSTGKWKAVLDKIVAEGIKIVRFTGGEPAVRKDIFELCEYAQNKGLHVTLNTNGTARDLTGIKINKALVSMHGFDKESDNAVSKIDGFEKKINNINSFDCPVVVDTIVSAENVANFDKYEKLVSSLPIKTWFWSPQAPIAGAFPFAKSVVDDLIKKVVASKLNVIIAKGSALPLCFTEGLQEAFKPCCDTNHWFTCGGHGSIVIDPDGVIRPCYSMRAYLGNISETTFAEVLESAYVKSIRAGEFLRDECKQCALLLKCGGGCQLIGG